MRRVHPMTLHLLATAAAFCAVVVAMVI